jgi:hypothetical protein
VKLFKSMKYALVAFILAPGLAMAGGIPEADPTTYKSRSETSGYVGLQWLLGEKSSTVPDLVVGVRNTSTSKSNKVSGADLSVTYSFTKNQLGALRLGYVGGKCDVLGTAGVGYDFSGGGALGYLGAVGPYSKVFGQLGGQGFGLGLELNTQDCAKDRKKGTEPDEV